MDDVDCCDAFAVSEAERVLAWRTSVCLGLGLGLPDADLVAASTVDVRELERLIRQGCEPRLAAEILL